mmetsp:Transcript_48941/g.111481  ORF Transcript_48941/g.111481 Transcript_48941/m.111481 type:complete len:461 (+) Transcript_48941:1702-3084(+)
MVWPSNGGVLEAMRAWDLFTGLDAHLHVGNDDVVLRELHLGAAHNEPLACPPGLVVEVLILGMVKAALHSGDRLLMLAHGKLLEVVIGLEKHLTRAGACQPVGLEALHLHVGPGIVVAIKRIQREPHFRALPHAHLEGQGEILEVHCSRWLQGRGHARAITLLHHEAAHATLRDNAAQLLGRLHAAGDRLDAPPDGVIRTLCLLLGRLHVLSALVILLQELRPASSVHAALRIVSLGVGDVANGKAALLAQKHLLAIRVLDSVEILRERLHEVLGLLVLGHLGEGSHQGEPGFQLRDRGTREGAGRSAAHVPGLEPQARVAIHALHTHRHELSSRLLTDHLAMPEATGLHADLIADVEERVRRMLAEAAGVAEGALQRADGPSAACALLVLLSLRFALLGLLLAQDRLDLLRAGIQTARCDAQRLLHFLARLSPAQSLLTFGLLLRRRAPSKGLPRKARN